MSERKPSERPSRFWKPIKGGALCLSGPYATCFVHLAGDEAPIEFDAYGQRFEIDQDEIGGRPLAYVPSIRVEGREVWSGRLYSDEREAQLAAESRAKQQLREALDALEEK